MISAKQLKNILDFSFTSGSTFIAPDCSFTITPSSYTTSGVPASISLSGTITPNDGVITGWTILDGSATILNTGTGLTASATVSGGSVPTTAGSYNFTLLVYYEDTAGNSLSTVCVESLLVTATSYYGQLPNPGDNIVVPGDLVPFLGGLTTTDQATLINLFPVVCAATGRITLVIPYSYGAVVDISDNTDTSVLSQFNLVDDPGNNQWIYTTINTVTPATYYFKVTF